MSSAVQIANLALSRLGAARITSFADGTETANLINVMFDDIVDDVLVAGPWSSAIVRATLALLDETPEYEFSYVFQLPSDPYCLSVLDIYENKPGDIDYRVEGRKVLANIAAMKIRYIARLTDATTFDVMLRRVVVSRLVAELAYTVTGDKTTAANAWKKYEMDLQDALTINNQQGSIDKICADDLLDVR